MDHCSYQYYKINKTLLSLVGLWPFDIGSINQIHRIVFSVTLVSGMLVQLGAFVKAEWNVNVFLKFLGPFIISASFVLKYHTFYFKTNAIKDIIERMKADWANLKNRAEIEIIQKYAIMGRYHTMIFALFIYPSTFAFIVCQYAPHVLDIVIPLNVSRSYLLPVMVEYWFDQEKYVYLVALHVDIVILVGSTTLVATETICIVKLQHACGLFNLVSYRVNQAFSERSLRALFANKNFIFREHIIDAVDIHKRAIEFAQSIKTNFTSSYFILLSMGVVSLSVNLFRLSQAILFLDEIDELFTSMLFVTGHFGYIFYINYMVQQVIDHSNYIFNDTYNANWYLAPQASQKLVWFIMQKSFKPFMFNMFGLYNPSIEGFSLIAKMSLSYFMVIYSTQNSS